MKKFSNWFDAIWVGIYEMFLLIKAFKIISTLIAVIAVGSIFLGYSIVAIIILVILAFLTIFKIVDTKEGLDYDEYNLEVLNSKKIKRAFSKIKRSSKTTNTDSSENYSTDEGSAGPVNLNTDKYPTVYGLDENSEIAYEGNIMIIKNNPIFAEKGIDEVNLEYEASQLKVTFFNNYTFVSDTTFDKRCISITQDDLLSLIQ